MSWPIAVRSGLEPALILRMLTAHALTGVEQIDALAGTHTRLLPTSAGWARVSVTPAPDGIWVDAEPTDQTTVREVAALVRNWFDLGADLHAVRAVLGRDPLLAPLIAARPGLRPIGYPEPFEAAMMAVLGQQVSVAAARTFGVRLVAALGAGHPSGLHVFPSPDRVAATSPAVLQERVGVTHARAATLQAVAAAYAAAGPWPWPPVALDRRQLLEIHGVGPWTADYLAVRAYADRDGFTPGDLVLRRALGNVTTAAAEARAEAWRPFRAYALFHLWVSAYYLP